MKRVMNEGQPQNKIFLDSLALKTITQISPRITQLYERISRLLHEDRDYHLSADQFKSKLNELCRETITYKSETVGGPICRENSKKTAFFHCFDCEKDVLTSICEECFSEGQHLGHNFRMYTVNCYCDCGNQQMLNQQYFCSRHKNFKSPSEGNISQAKIFSTQVQFLFLLSCLSHENMTTSTPIKKECLLLTILPILTKNIRQNYRHQKLIAQILLKNFNEIYNYRGETVLELLLEKINWSEKAIKQISNFVAELHSVYALRKQTIIHYWNVLKTGAKSLKFLAKMQVFNSQFLCESNIILKLLRKGIIEPIFVGQNASTAAEQTGRFIIAYKFYEKLAQSRQFPLMIAQILRKMEIWRLFNFSNCVKEQENIEVLNSCYLSILLQIVDKVGQLENKREYFSKMMRECLSYLRKCDRKLMSCPKITFSLCLFSLFDFDLSKIKNCTKEHLMMFFEGESGLEIAKLLSKILFENCELIVNAQREDKDIQINPQVILAIEYLFFKIAFEIINKFQQDEEVITLQMWITTKLNQLDIIIPKKDKNNRNSGDKICQFLLNLAYSHETQLPQLIISNYFKHPDKNRIIDFYRQLCSINRELTKIKFKTYADLWISNEDCLKEFITNQFGQYYKNSQLKDRFTMNISFLSEFLKHSKIPNDQVNQRFNINMTNPNQNQFLPSIIGQNFLKFIEELLKTLVERQLKNKIASQSRNYLVEILIVIYLWSKSIIFLNLFDSLLNEQHLNIPPIYKQYRGKIQLMLDSKNQPNINEKKNLSKEKRLQKLKQIKSQQQKFLKQYQEPIHEEKIIKSSETEDFCIVCRAPKNEKLNYLCSVSFSKNFMKNILKVDEYFVLITTCGHKIHESCFSSSINPNETYSANFNCFLCKKKSNMRIPIYEFYTQETQRELGQTQNQDKKSSKFYKFLEQFFTVLSLVISENPSLKHQKIQIHHFGKILTKSIILAIYFYFLSYPKFYITNMLPLLKPLCSLAKFCLQNVFSSEVYINNVQIYDQELIQTEKMILQILQKGQNTVKFIENQTNENFLNQNQYSSYIWQDQIDKLKLYLSSTHPINFNLHKRIERLNLYNIPKDLALLNKQLGFCQGCKHITSKLKICFYCGFKICSKCKYQSDKHAKVNHCSQTIMIDVQFGQHYYFYEGMNQRCQSLYCNYVGEMFRYEHKRPKEGEFMLDEKLYESLLVNSLLQNMKEIVESQQINEGCQVQ